MIERVEPDLCGSVLLAHEARLSKLMVGENHD